MALGNTFLSRAEADSFSVPKNHLEPEYADVYGSWKTLGDEPSRDKLLQTITPLIERSVRDISGADPNYLAIRGKILALNSLPKYDPEKSSLATFLSHQLLPLRRTARQQMNVLGLPDRLLQSSRELESAETELQDDLGRTPTTQELSDRLHISVKQIERIRRMGHARNSGSLRILHSDRNVDGVHSGLLILGDPTGKTGQELPLEAIHLQGVEEAVERESIGLAFPASRHSSLLARVTVPYDESFDQFLLTFFFGILVTRSGNIASDILKLSYRIIESPHENNMITQAFPQNSLQQLACDFQVRNTQYSTGYYTAESSPFPVTPGDLVCLKIERTPPDNFSDRIILLRKTAMIGL